MPDTIEGPDAQASAPGVCSLLTVSEQTPLDSVLELLPANADSLILVADANSQVIGAIGSQQIQNRLNTGADPERRRWRQMPIGTLMPVRLPASFQSVGILPCAPLTVTDTNNCPTAILAENDVYISWRSLLPELQSAFCDRLTGLPNRAGLEFRLKQDWLRAAQLEAPLALFVIDLDHFKQVNDTHGHAYADSVLRDVAGALNDAVRSYDLVARFGGDEFVASCVGCAPDAVDIPIRRLMDSLELISGLHPELPRLSVTVGAAVCWPHATDSSPDELFRSADGCLYEAKRFRRGTAYLVNVDEADAKPELISE